MSPLAATATTAVVLSAIYAGACVVRPFAACRRCAGTGQRHTLLAGEQRCGRCRGGGRRLRFGRRIYNVFAWLHVRAVPSKER